jgi:hypothetical protein
MTKNLSSGVVVTALLLFGANATEFVAGKDWAELSSPESIVHFFVAGVTAAGVALGVTTYRQRVKEETAVHGPKSAVAKAARKASSKARKPAKEK